MARRYRMTPKRRAALAKAREASARKRRRQRRKNIAKGAVGAVTVVSLAGAGYKAGNYYRQGAALAGLQPSVKWSSSKELVHVTGQGRTYTQVKKKPKYPKQPKRPKYHVFKVDKKGTAKSTTMTRVLYDRSRRAGLVAGYERKPRPKTYKKRR